MRASIRIPARAPGLVGLLALGLAGCLETAHPPLTAASGAAAPAAPVPGDQDPAWLREKALERPDPATGQRYIRDPESGEEYLLNPGWRVMTPEPSGAAAKAAASTNTNSQTDWSGQVETRWYECVSPSGNVIQGVTCQVEPGWVLVGGGAFADYGTGTGAFLTETRPLDGNLVTWVASSKDHTRACAHRLRVYAIGMRLKDNYGNIVPSATLRSYMATGSQASAVPSSYPAHYTGKRMLDGYETHILGGGAKTHWTAAGNLLIRSIAALGHGSRGANDPWYLEVSGYGPAWYWVAMGRDLSRTEATTISAWDIRILEPLRWIPNFGRLETWTRGADAAAPANTLTPAKLSADEGWVLTCPGGDANPDKLAVPPERILVGVRPEFQAQGQAIAAAYSKDHAVARAGKVRVSLTQIRKYR